LAGFYFESSHAPFDRPWKISPVAAGSCFVLLRCQSERIVDCWPTSAPISPRFRPESAAMTTIPLMYADDDLESGNVKYDDEDECRNNVLKAHVSIRMGKHNSKLGFTPTDFEFETGMANFGKNSLISLPLVAFQLDFEHRKQLFWRKQCRFWNPNKAVAQIKLP